MLKVETVFGIDEHGRKAAHQPLAHTVDLPWHSSGWLYQKRRFRRSILVTIHVHDYAFDIKRPKHKARCEYLRP